MKAGPNYQKALIAARLLASQPTSLADALRVTELSAQELKKIVPGLGLPNPLASNLYAWLGLPRPTAIQRTSGPLKYENVAKVLAARKSKRSRASPVLITDVLNTYLSAEGSIGRGHSTFNKIWPDRLTKSGYTSVLSRYFDLIHPSYYPKLVFSTLASRQGIRYKHKKPKAPEEGTANRLMTEIAGLKSRILALESKAFEPRAKQPSKVKLAMDKLASPFRAAAKRLAKAGRVLIRGE